MVNVLLEPDEAIFRIPNKITTIYDPTCGTGGMLSEGEKFDYMLANPPFGLDWKGQQTIIEEEHKKAGFAGRYGPKLPRVNDGALLFLLHMISKFHPTQKPAFENTPLFQNSTSGSRAAVVLNGSPLFTGGAGSGESEIRRWIIENDWLEAIIALPEKMFYNTGIGTFIWIVTNRKVKTRKGKIQLIDARERWTAMRRSLGDKRRYLNTGTIDAITREHGTFITSTHSKIFDNHYFGYRRITVERPLRLQFQITQQAKEIFLESAPEYLDVLRELEKIYGLNPHDNWNPIRDKAEEIAKKTTIKWTAKTRKFFREVFCSTNPTAKPVISKTHTLEEFIGAEHFPDHSTPNIPSQQLDALFGIYRLGKGKKTMQYEPDPKLRDSENVPLQENITEFFTREVQPFLADAWIDPDTTDEKDGGIGKKGFEMNFNREFFKYNPPRPLEIIDAELESVEQRILKLLSQVTH